ncbi:hypothetical protein CC85DRAFT_288900 [Cutaneotrichosporon oleaginosum]|uniref:NOT2/NOT3/NOT5 C-terminal domain-containing protein n=2 Tax=Cutaneotrichosporon oleaginosum TaxID=879819 RepID=A0A0J0XDD2_9TREE|nr:uncharacterized protein CC85DRAFT_288900 [Cutaneotrichosporon oleaginosum]KLT39072.1 hypothetical protein CC85DRAFT_288900 [Cutaneotrichosporon oleaginosum]
MNRAGGQPRQSTVPPGYRAAQPTAAGANGMFYGGPTMQNRGTGLMGQGALGGFPPSGALGRSGPPGIGGRGADPNDFPALGSHNQHGNNSTYASQAQPSQAGSSHLQQQMYNLHIGQGQGQMDSMAPPPPPGLSGPAGSSSQPNGAGEGLRDDFPALGVGEKERMAGVLKIGGGANQPTSPQQSLNGPGSSHSATPANMGQGPPSAAGESWARQSPSRNEPLLRQQQVQHPVHQILTSPVDKWGLKALLHQIRQHMNKDDRGMLMFGEDLVDLGVDVASQEPLYQSFVTPWADPGSQTQPPQIEDMYVIPSCYHVVPPPVESKMSNFNEETLFFQFYSAPQDMLQLMAAEELYTRGWRFNTDTRVWMLSPQLSQIDFHNDLSQHPPILRGHFTVFDPASFSKRETHTITGGEEYSVELAHFEATRRASDIAAEQAKARKESVRSPEGNSSSILGSNTQHFQSMAVAH